MDKCISPLFNRSQTQLGWIPTEANLRALLGSLKNADPGFCTRASFCLTLKAEGRKKNSNKNNWIKSNLPNLCPTKQDFTYVTVTLYEVWVAFIRNLLVVFKQNCLISMKINICYLHAYLNGKAALQFIFFYRKREKKSFCGKAACYWKMKGVIILSPSCHSEPISC